MSRQNLKTHHILEITITFGEINIRLAITLSLSFGQNGLVLNAGVVIRVVTTNTCNSKSTTVSER